MKRVVGCTGVALLIVIVGSASPALSQPLSGPAQDPLAGSRVFGAKGCVTCHAINGAGGKIGPDLGRIARPRSFFDLATAMWNHLPRMTERMRQLGIARPSLEAREAADLIAFLYTIHYFEPPGSPDVGRRLFTDRRCVVCHQVGDKGGVVGPNLTFLKLLGSPLYVAAAMWNHGPQMTEAMKVRGIQRPAFTGQELRDLLAYFAPASAGPQEGPVYALPGRAETGQRLFAEKRCVECHGTDAQGGRVAPNLGGRGVRRGPIEFAAAMWNKAPAMTEAMKTRGIPIPQLRADEMADIVGYLYAVRYFGDAGDVRNGWTVATYKGCLVCHAAGGERGKPASDLARAKGLDSPAAVLAALWNHAVVTPPHIPGSPKTGWPEFRPEEMADLVALLQSFKVRR